MRKKGRDMNEIAGLCACRKFSSFTPTHFASAGEDVGDRLLLSMVVNSSPRSRSDSEQTAPDSRRDAQRGSYSRTAFGARCLGGPGIELRRADDMDGRSCTHGVPDHL